MSYHVTHRHTHTHAEYRSAVGWYLPQAESETEERKCFQIG